MSRSNKKPCNRNRNTGIASHLPQDVIFLILNRLSEHIDHLRFAAVCKEWYSSSKVYNHVTQRWRTMLPMLLIPHDRDHQGATTLYSISQRKILKDIRLRVHYMERCCGSSHSWLATTDRHLIVSLRNPFRKHQRPLRLPPLDVFLEEREVGTHEHYVHKVILSADPIRNPKDCFAVAIYGRNFRLAFSKAGQKHWTFVSPQDTAFGDVIFYQGQIFVANMLGGIQSLDVNNCRVNNPSKLPQLNLVTPDREQSRRQLHRRSYLVESTKGELLNVVRIFRERRGGRQTIWFLVKKLVFDDKDGSFRQLVDLKTIADEALFVGDNHSVSVVASNFPECRSNSIYYIDDFVSGNKLLGGCELGDMGIFNLEDRTITNHYSPANICHQRPIWVVPPA